ncbi:MAG TPA: hypothetical protein VFP72_23415 [Kineosporiaceae bacterium]|nr:hypothetical protein [Kineosporiaceae bacterium]
MASMRERRLLKTAAGAMQPGETVELIAMARLSSAKETVRRNAAGAAAGMAASLLASAVTGGTVMGTMAFAPQDVYLVLSDRQLMFFEANPSTGGPGRYLVGFPRSGLRVLEFASGFFLKMLLDLGSGSAPMLLTFPPIPPKIRRNARALAAALPPAAGTAPRY